MQSLCPLFVARAKGVSDRCKQFFNRKWLFYKGGCSRFNRPRLQPVTAGDDNHRNFGVVWPCMKEPAYLEAIDVGELLIN